MGHLTYPMLPIRRADRLFSASYNDGQEERLQQEAAARAREPRPAAICFYRVIVTAEGRWVIKGGFTVLATLFS